VQIVDAAAPVLASLVVALLAWLTAAVQKNVKSATAQAALTKLSSLASDVVLELEQTVVGALRESATDGSISRLDAENAKTLALAKLKAHLGAAGKAEVLAALGYKDEADLDALLSTKIEAEIAKAKSTVGRKLTATIENQTGSATAIATTGGS
jgi:hypothetical protein